MTIKDKVILITGGAKGIGLATALKFSLENQVIVIDSDYVACNKLTNDNIKVYSEDITNYSSMDTILKEIYTIYGNIDILINNAAVQTVNNISSLTLDDWQKVIEVNLTATFYITQFVANRMIKGNTILNLISTHYDKPRVDKLHYDVSKAGVALFTKGYAIELAKKRVTINALAIGATYTHINNEFNVNPKIANEAKEKIPLKYISTPDDIANHIYNIINNFSEATTGSIFMVDGGRNLI